MLFFKTFVWFFNRMEVEKPIPHDTHLGIGLIKFYNSIIYIEVALSAEPENKLYKLHP